MSRIDEKGSSTVESAPITDREDNELGHIVKAEVGRWAWVLQGALLESVGLEKGGNQAIGQRMMPARPISNHVASRGNIQVFPWEVKI